MSPSSCRSRFFENTEWSQAAQSTPLPTNQGNSRSYFSRSDDAGAAVEKAASPPSIALISTYLGNL